MTQCFYGGIYFLVRVGTFLDPWSIFLYFQLLTQIKFILNSTLKRARWNTKEQSQGAPFRVHFKEWRIWSVFFPETTWSIFTVWTHLIHGLFKTFFYLWLSVADNLPGATLGMLDMMDLTIYGMKNDRLTLQLKSICSFKLWSLQSYLSFSLILQVWNSLVTVYGVEAWVYISFPAAGMARPEDEL